MDTSITIHIFTLLDKYTEFNSIAPEKDNVYCIFTIQSTFLFLHFITYLYFDYFLENYLKQIAKTGYTRFPWHNIKTLFKVSFIS